VVIEKAVKKLKSEKKFIIIDSLTTILIYNKEDTLNQFLHNIVGKFRSWNTNSVLLMGEYSHKKVINALSQFCDKIIEL